MVSTIKPKQVNFNDLWPIVLTTVRSVINMSRYGHTDQLTWQNRFSDIYDMCAATPDSYAEKLYEETTKFLEDHCISMKKDIVESEQNMLNIYVKYWTEYKMGAEHLNSLYTCLNNLIVKKHLVTEPENNMILEYTIELNDQSPVEIGEMALDCWTKIIIEPLKDRLVKLLLEQIYLDRIGECVNQTIIKNVIISFVDVYQYRKINTLELYENSFESHFLQTTGEYYREEGNHHLAKLNCIQYMKKILLFIDDEEFRSRKFLNPTSYIKVNNECLQRLVCDHYDTLKNECNELILQQDFDALQNMYKLLKPTHIGTNYMVEQLQANITYIGNEKIQSLKGENLPTLFVETLLELHTKYLNIIRETFANDPDFISSLDKACTIIVNMKNGNCLSAKAPELLAHYCDNLLRKSSKTLTENEIEEKLLHGITIFNYLEDKDYFQRFYQKMLARRLINQQSTSMDAEEFIVTKLKEICGYEFTAKLARMFQDMKVSNDLYIKFLDYLKSESSSNVQNQTMTNLIGLDFNIYVLQANSWPIAQLTTNTFLIPQPLEKPLHLFEAFYNKQYNGRKLCWIYNLSNGEIRMSHLDRSYVVTMCTYQMAILLIFNQHDKLTLHEIAESTKLNMKELEKQILPLIENKFLLNNTNNLTSKSIISINFEYKSKRTKFKISTTIHKETRQDSEISQKIVDDDRKFYLQAIIVRIMKSRKILKHNLLIEEVITQSKLRFIPSIHLIKKCIEILIDKQYLERNLTDEYTYIA
ncbi:unnamed protein product [Rotaria sordida]|uniref:Cullin family profile domain-containing protein n=1 Tax=Rotaria sordida TaxID=392033 RepID=A0A814XB54_9BILA|nr:unnamed protein product [Rotaria sordida]CAF1213890.1 unnamed protein product [Rotaria sordida]